MRGYREVLRGPFARVWAALVVSHIGENAGYIALLWVAAKHGGGTSAVGVLAAAVALPAVASGAFAGVVLDRLPRPLVIALDNSGRAILYALLALVAAAPHFSLPAAAALVAAASLLSPLSQAGVQSLVPDVVPPEHRGRANAAVTGLWQLRFLVGPAIGGLLTARYGPVVPIALQAVGYAIAALVVATVCVSATDMAPEDHTSPWDGALLLLRSPDIRAIALFSLVFALVNAPFQVVLPQFVSHDLHQSAAIYGSLWAAVAVGALVGTAIAGTLPRLRRFGLWLAAEFLLLGITQALLGEARTAGLAFVAVSAAGFVYAPYETWTATYIQQVVPGRLLGRVFGTYTALLGVGLPIGALLTGALASAIGSRALLAGSGAADRC